MKRLLFIIILFNSIFSNSQSWSVINSPTTLRLNSCSFLNENLGWIVTGNSIYKTINGGTTWTSQNFPVSPSHNYRFFNSVHFINHNVGIIACGNYLYSGNNPNLVSTILWTNDGGINWVYKDLGSSNDYDLSAILVSPLIAYSIGQYGQSKKTIDGGLTWTPCSYSSNTGYSGARLFALDQNNVYFAGLQNISLTAAIGKINNLTWIITDFPSSVIMQGIYFSDINNGWVVGDNGVIKITNNGGYNWLDGNSNVTASILNVSFKDNQKGWAVTSDGKIIKSVDGGINWVQDYNGSTSLNDITFKNLNGYGYAVGDNGKILKYNSNLSIDSFTNNYYTIFPNPSNNTIFINTQDIKSKIVTIEIIDSVGKIVKKNEVNDYSVSINIENLEKGLYFVKIINEDNNICLKKIIKN